MKTTLLEAPLEVLRRIVSSHPWSAVLESGPGFGPLGRYSILAPRPLGIFQARGNEWSLSDDWPGRKPDSNLDALSALRSLLKQTSFASELKEPFQGGWIGYFGYDLAPLLERLPRRWARDLLLPDIHFAYYDAFALHDNQSRTLTLHQYDHLAGLSQFDWEHSLKEFNPAKSHTNEGLSLISGPIESNFTPDEYCWTIEQILEYIRAGDIFQANFAHRFSARFSGTASDLYERCVKQSPAPFGAMIRGGDCSVVSTSPERFFLLEPDGRIETRPIKGTRPRGRDGIHDLLLREALADSPKDRAELNMIVDLERNDLGRVCDFGSVRVARHAQIETYSNVHHLVSTVTGRLREGCDVIDVVGAMFPGGSITGAPKIRAMEIIDELERCRRGVYTGAIGYISDHGRADFNIAIRTLTQERDRVHYHVGGGIVADSDPLSEYRETLAKGLRLREVLTGDAS